MEIYNQAKTQLLENVDLEKGYLKADIMIVHHEAIPAIVGKSAKQIADEKILEGKRILDSNDENLYFEVNTDNSLIPIVGIKEQAEIPAYDEKKVIRVFVPYTNEELIQKRQEKYEAYVDDLIRKKYTISQEFAILRQKDEKPEEYQAYHDYAEQCKATAKTEILGV